MNTEFTFKLTEINDFAHSTNRASDWSNLLTCHKNMDKAYLWSVENKTIVKKNIDKPQHYNKLRITSIYVTHCGNFGVLGFENGNLLKFNM